MKHLCFAAVAMLASTVAHAQNAYNFEIDGRKIRIAAARNCNALSCLSVSIPGVYETGQKRRFADRNENQDRNDDTVNTAPAPSAPVKPAPVDSAATAQPRPVLASPSTVAPSNAPAAPQVASPVAPRVSVPVAPQQQADLSKDLVTTPSAVAQPLPQPSQPTIQAEPSPLGIWNTEDRKGQVRIEACGKNLCGYAVNSKPGVNGKKVLIDLKQASSTKWGGQIYDPNSGSTYDSTVTLKAGDTLRVQGCAFGGMFCGGQTWTRAS